MPSNNHNSRPLSVLLVDPTSVPDHSDGDMPVEVEYCATGREALRRADEAFYIVVLSTSIEDIAYQDLAEMIQSESPATALVVVSDEPNAAEEVTARRSGAMLYVGKPLDIEWLAQPRTRPRTTPRNPASQLTLDWHRRPQPAVGTQPAPATH